MPHSNVSKGGGLVPVVASQSGLASAAVVAPIFRHRGVWRLFLIRRADTVSHHRGQYAFPGGRWEVSDKTLWHTARREAWEEVGWDPVEMRLLAVLPVEITTNTGFSIQPFLIQMPWPLATWSQPSEVAGVIAPPLTFFAENHHRASLASGGPCYHYQSCVIWGATARIIHGLMVVLADVLGGEG